MVDKANSQPATGPFSANRNYDKLGKPGYTNLYESRKTRPDTTAEQLDAGRDGLAAAERRIFGSVHSGWASASLLGSAIRADGGTSLVGQTIAEPNDLTILAQVLRDPRF